MQRIALCRSRRELSNAYFLAKSGFDTAENEPCQVCPLPRNAAASVTSAPGALFRGAGPAQRDRGRGGLPAEGGSRDQAEMTSEVRI